MSKSLSALRKFLAWIFNFQARQLEGGLCIQQTGGQKSRGGLGVLGWRALTHLSSFTGHWLLLLPCSPVGSHWESITVSLQGTGLGEFCFLWILEINRWGQEKEDLKGEVAPSLHAICHLSLPSPLLQPELVLLKFAVIHLLLARVSGDSQWKGQTGSLKQLQSTYSSFLIPKFPKPTARWQEQHQTSPECRITTQDRSDVLGKVLSAALGDHSVCVSMTDNSLQTALSTLKMHFPLPAIPHCCSTASPRGAGNAAPLGRPYKQLPCLSSIFHYCSSLTILPALIKTRVRGKAEMSSLWRVHTYLSTSVTAC